jgi:DNA-binding MarR family transcriptional regulator
VQLPRDLTDTDYRALAEFRHQLRRFMAFSETAARAIDLEPRQHQLLLALRGLAPGVEPSVAALADALVLRHNTVVELLDRLEAAGLIRRTRAAADRRRAEIALTPRAEDLLRQLSAAHLDELRSLAPALVGSLNLALRASRRRAP